MKGVYVCEGGSGDEKAMMDSAEMEETREWMQIIYLD